MPTNRDSLNRVRLPQLFEVWEAEHATGSFIQRAGPFDETVAREAYKSFSDNPEFTNRHLMLVRVDRTAIDHTADASMIGKPARDFSRKDN